MEENFQKRVDGSSDQQLITYVENRAGHDRRYAIDATKLETELGWKADEDFDTVSSNSTAQDKETHQYK